MLLGVHRNVASIHHRAGGCNIWFVRGKVLARFRSLPACDTAYRRQGTQSLGGFLATLAGGLVAVGGAALGVTFAMPEGNV